MDICKGAVDQRVLLVWIVRLFHFYINPTVILHLSNFLQQFSKYFHLFSNKEITLHRGPPRFGENRKIFHYDIYILIAEEYFTLFRLGIDHQKIMESVFNDFHFYTCVQFLKRTKEKTYLTFRLGDESSSDVGFKKDKVSQVIYVSKKSMCDKSIIKHTIMHALGFFDQQQASNRDDYVTINLDNVKGTKFMNFMKLDAYLMPNYGVEYDYASIMHLSRDAYSRNGGETIIPKVSHMKIYLKKIEYLNQFPIFI